MDDSQNFAALMEASTQGGSQRTDLRLESGQIVEATVLEVASDWVFVDIGAPQDGRIERAEFGNQPPARGATLRATVLDPTSEGARLTTALGHGARGVDVSALELARQGGTPVHGEVVRAVKGGLEIKIGDLSAFCPASQVELGYTADLAAYVGQNLTFKVLELRDGGRSVVLSRKLLLEDERRTRESELLATLKAGADVTGTVSAIQRHGALVDIGGATGYVHISELAHHRVDRVEDVVREGEQIQARVLSVEPGDKGLRIRLSLKQLTQKPTEEVKREEILEGTVTRALNHGVLVDTERGGGLIPLKELGLPPGADHRRAFPPGKTLRVVVLSRDSKDGKLRFSAVGVAGVEERRNYKEFTKAQPRSSQGLGNLGDVLREKLGLPAASVATEPQRSTPEAARPPTVAAPPEGEVADEQVQAPSTPRAPAEAPRVKDRSGELGVVRRVKRN